MNEDIRIKIDQGTLNRSADGNVTLGGNAGCITWALLVMSALGAAGAVAGLVSGILRINSPGPDALNLILFMLLLAGFFGFSASHLYRNVSRGRVTLDPATKLLRLRDREISFLQISELTTTSATPPLMEGALVVTFHAVLTDGEAVSLCSISGNEGKLAERTTRILEILGETLQLRNARHADR